MKANDIARPWAEQRLWHSEKGLDHPKNVASIDDTTSADAAYKLACEGCGLLWSGDFQNARQLLVALARRCDKAAQRRLTGKDGKSETNQAFHLQRQIQAQRTNILGMLLIPLNRDFSIPLRRAPDVRLACQEVYGDSIQTDAIVSLRELQSLIGAHEWRKKGVFIPALQAKIYPHYNVFSPVRGEYIDLVAKAPISHVDLAFEIGAGTGVLAAVLAKRGVKQVIATEINERALRCARENIQSLGLAAQVQLVANDMFPVGRSPLIVCNPPWLPGKPSSAIEYAVYDPNSRMLKAFLKGLPDHLSENGEAWLIMSDLAEHLGLRSRTELHSWIDNAGLVVVDRSDTTPTHPKSQDSIDILHWARSREVTSLWRLKLKA